MNLTKKLKTMKTIFENENESELTLLELEKLKDCFEQHIEIIKSTYPNLFIKFKKNTYDGIDIYSNGFNLNIYFRGNSTLRDGETYIFISFWEGVSNEGGGIDRFSPYEQFEEKSLKFNINDQNKYGWSDIENGENFRLTTEVVTFWLDKFLEKVMKRILEKSC
jgi:hypothetical protein